jgi:hypothetical protein
MASQPGVFNPQQFTDNGNPAHLYRLYTYVQGTTTHKVAYTDAAGLVAQTYTTDGLGGQYIALDARGELAQPLFLASGPYDIALKTPAGATVWTRYAIGAADSALGSYPVKYQLAGSDLTTNLTTTALAGSFHVQADFTAIEVSASLDTASTSGAVTLDVKVGGVSRLSTLLTVDANEQTSYTAAIPAAFSNRAFLKGQLVVFSITSAGTGAKGLKMGIIGTPGV